MSLNGNLEPLAIYITLNSRPKKGEYHWGLVITDAKVKPTLHHATNMSGPWVYQERQGNPARSMSLIVLVRIGNVTSFERATQIINNSPANGTPSPRTGEVFTCRIWVKDTLVLLHQNGVVALPADIEKIEQGAIRSASDNARVSESGGGATVVNRRF